LIVQKYVEKPLLYNNRKFDIRVWVLVTDNCKIYYYKRGYLRTSSSEFTMDSTFKFIHLTNNCLQQYGKDYGKYEEGNIISFDTLQDYLNDTHSQISIIEHIVPRMKDIVIDTILAAKINKEEKLKCFELLGYDFIIDEDFRVWLIEVNTNPHLGTPNDYIKNLLTSMLNEMFCLILNYSKDNLQGFDLIYDPGKINVRRDYSKELMYPVKEKYQENSMASVFKMKFRETISDTQTFNSFKNIDDKLPAMSKRFVVPSAREKPIIKISFIDRLNNAIKNFNNTEITHLFYKYIIKLKTEPLSVLKIFEQPKIITTLINSTDICEFIESSLTTPLNQGIKEFAIKLLLKMSDDTLLKKRLVTQKMVHKILELLDIEILKVLKNLLKITPSYIPGQSLEDERVRIAVIQYGAVVALGHLLNLSKSEEDKLSVYRAIKSCVRVNEIKWTLKMLEDDKSVVIEGIELSDYFDMWTGRNLILSEYYSVMIS